MVSGNIGKNDVNHEKEILKNKDKYTRIENVERANLIRTIREFIERG